MKKRHRYRDWRRFGNPVAGSLHSSRTIAGFTKRVTKRNRKGGQKKASLPYAAVLLRCVTRKRERSRRLTYNWSKYITSRDQEHASVASGTVNEIHVRRFYWKDIIVYRYRRNRKRKVKKEGSSCSVFILFLAVIRQISAIISHSFLIRVHVETIAFKLDLDRCK